MQPTSLGANLTGALLSPDSVAAMNQAAAELTRFAAIDTSAMDANKLSYAAEADAVGSVPMPPSLKGMVKTGVAKLKGGQPTILIDKLGERLAYERTGTRLYDALLIKYQAALALDDDALPPASSTVAEAGVASGETPGQTLLRIRNEELAHFQMLSAAITKLGGDPTSMTPSADVMALASSGFMQVLNDPRTTLAQSLNTILAVELADNAGWELLTSLAEDAGEDDLAASFSGALAQERQHLAIVKAWHTRIVCTDPQPALV